MEESEIEVLSTSGNLEEVSGILQKFTINVSLLLVC